jgi:hypothetical protein
MEKVGNRIFRAAYPETPGMAFLDGDYSGTGQGLLLQSSCISAIHGGQMCRHVSMA